MKAGLLATTTLIAVASAQPHVNHRHLHAKRDYIETDYATVVDYVTATAPAVYVYVDQYGNRLADPSPTQAAVADTAPVVIAQAVATTEAAAAVAPAAATTAEQAPAWTPDTVSVAAVSIPAVVASVVAPVASAVASAAAGLSTSGLGISYSPYKGNNDCKTAGEVQTDMEALSGYPLIRLYGVDCDQITNVMAVLGTNQKVFLGIFHVDQYVSELASLHTQVNGRWSSVDTVSIGNEYVNDGGSVSTVVNAVNDARNILGGYGFHGSVVTVDTWTAIVDNKDLCAASDYVAANCHPFFDGQTSAGSAAKFISDRVEQMSSLCGKKVVITETGWPSGGNQYLDAIPSPANQVLAVGTITGNFTSNVLLFSAYNDYWKVNTATTYGVEHYWGIHGDSKSSWSLDSFPNLSEASPAYLFNFFQL